MVIQARFNAVSLLLSVAVLLGRSTLGFRILISSRRPSRQPQCPAGRVVLSLPRSQSSTRFLLDSVSSSSSSFIIPEREILCPYILVDEETGDILAQGKELHSLPEERDKPDEDELELLYPTRRQYFQFGNSSIHPVQRVRTTSFGCGKLGHQVWPSAVALSLALVHDYGTTNTNVDDDDDTYVSRPRSILELGAGCGLPSVVCRDVLGIPVTATDFWYEEDDDPSSSSFASATATRDWDRLIPEIHHGINLQYNVAPVQAAQGQGSTRFRSQDMNEASRMTRVQPLDWHDMESVQKVGPVDLVIGSDVIYYPMDVQPLWNTMETLLRNGGATKITLVLPLHPDKREALPEFLELLESKSSSSDNSDFHVERQGLFLFKSLESLEAREDGAHFLKLSISLRK